MKFNKSDPKHWYYFAKSGGYILTSIAIRPLIKTRGKKHVTLYGHKYNGNLKTFAEYCKSQGEYDVYFATIDPAYYRELRSDYPEINVLFLQKFRDVIKVSKSAAVISDRRAHALVYYIWLTNIPFFDVWHGIQMFKRFAPKNMAMLKKYREVWAPSPAVAKLYSEQYLLPAEKIKVTGYGRVDPLVNNQWDAKTIKKKYGIAESYKKIILLAPTWQQGDPTRQVIPFGEDPERFLGALNDVAKELEALVIFRVHLNTDAQNRSNVHAMDNVRIMSHNDYPLGEEFLFISDIFIGDWSSIAFDFLPLRRPAIFLDVPIPFRNGLTFGKENRYGAVVGSLDELVETIRRYALKPETYTKEHTKQIKKTIEIAYGNTLDGKSNQRYYERLKKTLEN